MIMDFPKQGHALVIVAHPDDEILEGVQAFRSYLDILDMSECLLGAFNY